MVELQATVAPHRPVQDFRRKSNAAEFGYTKDGMEFLRIGAVVKAVEMADPPQESCKKRTGVGAGTEPEKGHRAGLWSDRSGYKNDLGRAVAPLTAGVSPHPARLPPARRVQFWGSCSRRPHARRTPVLHACISATCGGSGARRAARRRAKVRPTLEIQC